MDSEVSRRKYERDLEQIRTVAAANGWEIAKAEYPILDVVLTHPRSKRRVGFHFVCDDWNEQAPSLILFDPEFKSQFGWDQWPQGGWSVHADHPTLHRPFLCLAGIREFHLHSSHLNDHWSGLRGKASYSLGNIVHRVQQRFGDTNG